MYTVHGMALSGNCYKLKLALELLGEPYQWQEVDTLRGETRSPAFLAMNPNGKVPVLTLPDGSHLAESNAILCYLAEGTDLWAGDRRQRAEVLQWLFFEQYSHEPYIATVRFWVRFAGKAEALAEEIAKRRVQGYKALDVMEQQLATRAFLAGTSLSIADIALFAYTHVAEEGGFSLVAYPHIRAWLARVQSTPGFVPMG
ncbi:glutathione S-transferase family protein [Chitinimonas sp. BJYL2]|uniref:glutathione S-transferase family protein n=1 Tax=Chitinimonas sp. BJYL2 TaxID=2976696 RepID=UPI0022B354BC|nr:glutathione S-transferase family protein [Chitinimonas sp. BJYL2]